MPGTAPLTSGQIQAQVEGMMEQGKAFARVEDVIDTAQLSALHKSALWLLAWSLWDQAQQRDDARLMLAGVGARDWAGW